MKSVIFVLHTLNVGGGERHSITLANYLVSHGFDVTIVLLEDPIVRFKAEPGIRIVHLKNRSDKEQYDTSGNVSSCEIIEFDNPTGASLFEQVKLWYLKLKDKSKYDAEDQLIYFRNKYIFKLRQFLEEYPGSFVISFMTVCSIVTAAAVKGLPNKCMFAEFTSPATEYPKGHFMNQLKKRFYPNFIGGIYQTDEECDFYDYLSDKNAYVIPNPIVGTYPERFCGERKKIIVDFCRLNKAKNLFLLIDAFALFSEEHPDYLLHIYGEGPLKNSILSYINKLGLNDKVRLLGFNTELHGIIRDHAMFVSSSDYEGISNSMLEAMAIGLPTICTDCPAGGARMIIKDHVNGILVPLRDKSAMFNAMMEIAEDPGFAEILSENAVLVKQELSVDNIGKRWAEVIDKEMS